MSTPITDKKLEDFETQTPTIDKEVAIYNSDGDISKFWCAKAYGSVVVVTHRVPGKKPKLVGITDFNQELPDCIDCGGDYSAEAWIEAEAHVRAKRVPVIRKGKAEAKLLKLIQESGTDIIKLLAWSRSYNVVLFSTREEIMKDHYIGVEMTALPDTDHAEKIMTELRHTGESYFGGLKLARRFIEQIRPGGLADQLIAGVMDLVEKNLVPWAYVCGHLSEPVMLTSEPRTLAIKLIERYVNPHYDDLSFYKEGATPENLLDIIYERFIKNVKPNVLDALTLDG